MSAVWKNRSLLLLGAAEVVNNVGSWITSMALYSILIFEKGGGIAQSTAIMMASLAPTLLLSPLAGWLCDRFDRRMLMIVSRLLSAAVITALIFTESLPVIYLLLVLNAACSTIMAPARTTAVPDLVAPEALTQANAFMQQTTGLVKIVAPALAGGLLTVMRPETAMILDVISYLISAAILLLLPPLAPRRPEQKNGAGAKSSFLQTLREIAKKCPVIAVTIPLYFLLAVVIIAFDVSMSVYIRDVLESGIAYKGIIGGAVGAGTILGSAIFLLLKGERNAWRDMVAGFFLLASLPAALSLGDYLSPAVARTLVATCCFLGGLGIGVVNVQFGTLFQRMVPPEWLGRLSGFFQSLFVAGQITGMLITPLAVPSVVSFGVYFGASTLALLAAITFTVFAYARITRLNESAVAANEVALSEA